MISFSPWRMWYWMLHCNFPDSRVGIFRNLPGIKPGRWGFYVLGFEFGSRNPADKTGMWLKDHRLWPW